MFFIAPIIFFRPVFFLLCWCCKIEYNSTSCFRFDLLFPGAFYIHTLFIYGRVLERSKDAIMGWKVQHCSALYVQHSKKKKSKKLDSTTARSGIRTKLLVLGGSYTYTRFPFDTCIVISERFIVGLPCSCCKAYIHSNNIPNL